MVAFNIINLQDIENRLRIEAEFYHPDYMECQKTINKLSHFKLSRCSYKISDGTQFTPKYVTSGIKFYSAVNVKEGYFAYDESYKLISHAEHQLIHKRCPVQFGDVLIRKVGVGPRWSCVVPNGLDEFSIFVSVALVRPKEGLFPEYLSTFINSRYGQLQLLRLNKGISQPDLHLEDIGELLVPEFSRETQNSIVKLVKTAQKVREHSNELYLKAQNILETELGLDDLSLQKPVGYTARFSELELKRRLDSEHFYPAFHHLATHMPDHVKLVPLGSQLNFCQRGKQPVYSAKGLPVVNSKHVQSNKIVFEGNRKAVPNPSADLQIRFGDILMNGTGRGTLGRAAPYLADSQAIPDNHVTILRSPTLDPAYLSFYLNSQAGQLQVEMHQRGTSGQLELYPFDIRKFLVWVAPESFQKEIRDLYDRAAESELKSRELLDQAKTRVEQLIEKAASER